jgi:hypothetical protein
MYEKNNISVILSTAATTTPMYIHIKRHREYDEFSSAALKMLFTFFCSLEMNKKMLCRALVAAHCCFCIEFKNISSLKHPL